MDMSGEYRVAAPRAKVWEALNDPAVLKQCITGCEDITMLSPTEMTARVAARVGPVSARFTGKVTLSELDPPNGYRISGEGSGGVAGFAKGGATVKLADDGDGTKLAYKVEAQIGGKLAQIGSRLIDSTARKYAEDFFAKFAKIVGEQAAASAAAPPSPAPAPDVIPAPAPRPAPVGAPDPVAQAVPAPAAAPQPGTADRTVPPPSKEAAETGRLSPIIWVTVLAVVVAGLLYYFTR